MLMSHFPILAFRNEKLSESFDDMTDTDNHMISCFYVTISYTHKIYTGEETYHQCSYGYATLCNLELREYS